MESRSRVPRASSLQLPAASMRSVCHTHGVERKFAKLPSRDHESLRSTYQRMLKCGPDHFQIKPIGIPEMSSSYQALPNLTEMLDGVKRHIALSQDCRDGLEVTPILLLGLPGIGKIYLAKKLADFLGTGMSRVPIGSVTAGWLPSGSSPQ